MSLLHPLSPPVRRTLRALAAPIAVLLLASGCGGAADASGEPEPAGGSGDPAVQIDTSPDRERIRAEEVAAAVALLPQDVKDSGELVVGTIGVGAPPLAFRADDDTTVIGVEPDLAQLVADSLGLELELEPTSWENLFLAVESGQYDVGFSNITVTEERKDTYDFATYRVDTLGWEASVDSDIRSIEEPADIAGLTVSVGAGTNQEEILLRWDEQNRAAGLEPVEILYYQNPADYYLALQSGRIDLYFGPNPTAAYHAAVSGDTHVVGTVNGGGEVTAEIAAMTVKGSGLAPAVAEALNALIGSGEYGQVLERWGLQGEAVETSEVNPPGLPRS